MSKLKAEILLPLFYNNGTKIESQKYIELSEELKTKFGALSEESQIINGYWTINKKAYTDKNKVYWIIIADTKNNRNYFNKLQTKLKSIFKQESILILFSKIESIGA